jgi:thiopurine S-methyltransferase
MLFLETEGLKVIGSELSKIAAEDFFHENSTNNTEIVVGDIFNLTPKQLIECTCIYDRAALIALPKELRKKYVEHIRALIPKAKMLLITLDYDQMKMSGPPFSVDKAELETLFSFAQLKELHRANIIEKEINFKKKGLTSFNQTAYLIEW